MPACSRCKKPWPRNGYCTACGKEYRYEKYNYEKERSRWLKRVYGISLEEYEQLYELQGGMCAICHLPERRSIPGRRSDRKRPLMTLLSVDHDHETGKVRGLLCNPCNQSLGALEEDPERVKALLHYIEKWGNKGH